MGKLLDLDIEISRRTPIEAGLTFSLQPQFLSSGDSGGDFNRDFLLPPIYLIGDGFIGRFAQFFQGRGKEPISKNVTEKVSGTFLEEGVRGNGSGKKVPDTFSVTPFL